MDPGLCQRCSKIWLLLTGFVGWYVCLRCSAHAQQYQSPSGTSSVLSAAAGAQHMGVSQGASTEQLQQQWVCSRWHWGVHACQISLGRWTRVR